MSVCQSVRPTRILYIYCLVQSFILVVLYLVTQQSPLFTLIKFFSLKLFYRGIFVCPQILSFLISGQAERITITLRGSVVKIYQKIKTKYFIYSRSDLKPKKMALITECGVHMSA